MRFARLSLVLALAFCSISLFADQVTLKNGDRLTGTIIKSDGKSLVIKTEFAGEVTVDWKSGHHERSVHPGHDSRPERRQDRGRPHNHQRR